MVSVVAEKYLNAGELIIPLFFRRSTSILTDGEWGADHNKSIPIDVEWAESNVSERMAETGIEEPITQSVALLVKEETRLPNNPTMSEDWSGNEDLHPFWFIKRQKEGKEINCALMTQLVQSHTSMEWEDLQLKGANISGVGGNMVYVWYPFIVNTTAICKDEEVVLEFDKEAKKTTDNKRKTVNAFDQLKAKYNKKQHNAASASM